jgi:nucleoside-diphosphate-sugar epimerase
MRVAVVTGAGGFVGRHLCAELAERGWRVRTVSSQASLSGEPAGVSLGEADDGRLAAALAGADVVYHLAGVVHEASSASAPEAMTAINVETPARWLAAADRAGAGAFVWLSSIKVLGDVSASPLRVDAPYAPLDRYAQSKVAAERRLRSQSLSRTRLAVVRPPLVYGPGVKGNFLTLLRWAASGVPLPLARADAPRTMVGIDNLCDLLARLGSSPASGVYHVGDPEDVCVRDLLVTLRRGFGRPPRLFPLPAPLLAAAARAVGRQAAFSRLFDPLRVDTSGTRHDLGWAPSRSTREQLDRTLRWYETSR